MVGVVQEQEHVTQADQRVGTVRRAGQRLGAPVHVAHHVNSHITTVGGSGGKIVTGDLTRRHPKLVRPKLEWPNSYITGDAVREFSIPALAEIPASANLADAVFRRAAEQPQATVILRRPAAPAGSYQSWQDVTAAQFKDEVVAVAKGLVAMGIEAGDRVALMSHTRYEWTLIDYAIWVAGARDRAGLRDLLRRAGRMDPGQLGRAGLLRRVGRLRADHRPPP